jgi:hypothetical protein
MPGKQQVTNSIIILIPDYLGLKSNTPSSIVLEMFISVPLNFLATRTWTSDFILDLLDLKKIRER